MVSRLGWELPSNRNNESLRFPISACIAARGSEEDAEEGGGVRTEWADSVAAAQAEVLRVVYCGEEARGGVVCRVRCRRERGLGIAERAGRAEGRKFRRSMAEELRGGVAPSEMPTGIGAREGREERTE
jgi:hypothetical protein